ncbi:dihydroorotase [Candidatus Fermentibacterales bacterium]|nr:dihydroorotase [Candidatus Fermentibacterales bacterium]
MTGRDLPAGLAAGSWLVRGARLIDTVAGSELHGDIYLCREGVFPGPGEEGAFEIDGSDLWVFPGLLDMHVHLRVPGPGRAETLESGLRCALAGGVTSLCMMPNTDPPLDSPDLVRSLLESCASLGYPGANVAACLTRGRRGAELTDLEELHQAGARAFTDDGDPLEDDSLFAEALERIGALDAVLMEHPEVRSISAGGCVNEGRAARLSGVGGIPCRSEIADVQRCLELVRAGGGRLHLTHLSCPESVEMVAGARAGGLPVSCDVTPHHIALDDSEIRRVGAMAKMNPPLRTAEQRERLARMTAAGLVDAVASDHAPHPDSSKRKPIAEASFGITGLETLLPVTLEVLGREMGLAASGVISLLTTGPARVLGLTLPGLLGDGGSRPAVLFDPGAGYTLERVGTFSRSRNTPFLDRPLTGRVKGVWIGRPAYLGGMFAT